MPERKVDHGDEALYPLRHSTAHLLAGAVTAMFPGAKLGFGPPVANGFYYDFDLPRPLTTADLEEIESRMRSDVKANLAFEPSRMPAAEARELFSASGQPYKVEQIDSLEQTVRRERNKEKDEEAPDGGGKGRGKGGKVHKDQ